MGPLFDAVLKQVKKANGSGRATPLLSKLVDLLPEVCGLVSPDAFVAKWEQCNKLQEASSGVMQYTIPLVQAEGEVLHHNVVRAVLTASQLRCRPKSMSWTEYIAAVIAGFEAMRDVARAHNLRMNATLLVRFNVRSVVVAAPMASAQWSVHLPQAQEGMSSIEDHVSAYRRVAVQWDKGSVASPSELKKDVVGLGMTLAYMIRRCCED